MKRKNMMYEYRNDGMYECNIKLNIDIFDHIYYIDLIVFTNIFL